jgi:glycosyltransferase involved in cell wall biosynthesis
MRSKRLCIVTHTYLPHVGGIERVVYEQSKRLLAKGFDPVVVTSRMNTDRNYIVDGIRVHCYDSLNFGFGLGIPYSIPNVSGLGTFTESVRNSDIVHVHGHPYLSSLAAARIAKMYGKPVVLTQHNTFIKYERGIWDLAERLNDSIVGRQVLKGSDKIITVSKATRRYVLGLGADDPKIKVLHNGVDVDRFRPMPELREKIRNKLKIRQNAKVALSVRRLVYKNGVDTLIESAERAIKSNDQIDFLIVGAGPDSDAVRSKIERLGISDRCRLAGFVSDVELPAYYNAADVFVLPSKSGEGLPLVGLEAMSCGLPVVATDVGGISEVIPEGCGKLVPPDDPSALAEAILDFSQKDLLGLKRELRTIALRRFSWERNVESLIEIYEELI